MKYKVKTVRVSLACDAPGDLIEGPDDVGQWARAILQRGLDADRENFTLLSLDASNRVSGYKVISVGTVTACLVHPREVFRAALHLGAASIIVAHNHPSGDPTPSVEDCALTDRLVGCGDLLGIPVLDHIVFTAGQGCRSAKRNATQTINAVGKRGEA